MKQLISNRSHATIAIEAILSRRSLRCTVNSRDIYKGSNQMEATAPYHRESFDRSRSSIQDIFNRGVMIEDR